MVSNRKTSYTCYNTNTVSFICDMLLLRLSRNLLTASLNVSTGKFEQPSLMTLSNCSIVMLVPRGAFIRFRQENTLSTSALPTDRHRHAVINLNISVNKTEKQTSKQ